MADESTLDKLKAAMLNAAQGARGTVDFDNPTIGRAAKLLDQGIYGAAEGPLTSIAKGALAPREAEVLADNEAFKKNPVGHVMKSLLFGAQAMGPGSPIMGRPNVITGGTGAPAPPGEFFAPRPLAEPLVPGLDPVASMKSSAVFGSGRSVAPRTANLHI